MPRSSNDPWLSNVPLRALRIDAVEKTVTAIDLSGDPSEILEILACQTFRDACQDYEFPDTRPITGSLVTGFDTLIVNDDVLIESDYYDGPFFWFEITGATSQPIDGRGLVVGVDPSGHYCDVHISADELRKRVVFTRRIFRGYREDRHGRYEIIAPIIEEH